MSFRPENEAHGGESGRPPDEEFPTREAPAGGGERRRPVGLSRRRLMPLVVGLLLLALVVVAVLLWRSFGDRVGGTSVFEDSIESGPEPVVHVRNGPGRVRVRGAEGLESVEITAKRYARGRNPTAARENAASVPVNHSFEDSTLTISTPGGGGTGADYDLRVPAGSTVEVESATGDVEVSDLANDATIRAERGDVSVSDIQGSVNIEVPQGDVTAEGVGTETGRVEITVGSGDVDLRNLVVGLLEARVEAGDVSMSGRFSGGGRVFVETGSINVRLPSEDVTDLAFETLVGEVVRDDEQKSG